MRRIASLVLGAVILAGCGTAEVIRGREVPVSFVKDERVTPDEVRRRLGPPEAILPAITVNSMLEAVGREPFLTPDMEVWEYVWTEEVRPAGLSKWLGGGGRYVTHILWLRFQGETLMSHGHQKVRADSPPQGAVDLDARKLD